MLKGFQIAFQKDTLLTPIFCYAFTKLLIPRVKHEAIFLPLKLLLAALLLVLVLTTLCILSVWYELVHWYLCIKYGARYHGILNGPAAMMTCSNHPIIQIASAMRARDDRPPETFLAHFRTNGLRMMTAHPELRSTIATDLGYAFYKLEDDNLDINDFIKPLNNYSTPEEFTECLTEVMRKPLKYLWEVHVGHQAIHWPDSNTSEDKHIPIVCRFHHLLGDGVSVMALLTCYMYDDGVAVVRKRCELFQNAVSKSTGSKMAQLTNLAQREYSLLNMLEPEAEQLLHEGGTHPERCIPSFGLHDRNGEYFQKIRQIKQRAGVAFNDVVFAALSASLDEYITCCHSDRPKPTEFLIAMPYIIRSLAFEDLVDMTKPQLPRVRLVNRFSAWFVRVPLEFLHNPLMLLKDVAERNRKVAKSLDLPFLQWQMNVLFGLLPLPLVRFGNQFNDGTVLVSNVPGYASGPTLNGCVESDTIIWSMNLNKTGLTFLVFTHNNRLRVSLLHDSNFVQTPTEGRLITDSFFKFIDQLDKLVK